MEITFYLKMNYFAQNIDKISSQTKIKNKKESWKSDMQMEVRWIAYEMNCFCCW